MVAILQFVDAIEWWSKYGSYPSICWMLLNGGVNMVAILQFVDAIEWWSKYGSYPSIC